jgi:diguanylate cyclase (GGDEF)-like protein
MWFDLIAAALVVATGVSTAGWLRIRRRLVESTRERADLANSSRVIEEERRMLELVAQGAPLTEVLNTLTLAIERISPGALCTVMLLDEEHRRYLTAASGPSVGEEYLQAVNGLEIGPDVGACGTAAFLNETVVVADIATDPKFALARDFVVGHGLLSCWSQPIRDSRNNVLGTFAIYHRYIAKPRSEELRMSRAAAQLAGNAIERIRAEKVLSETAKRLSLAERVARFGIWEADFPNATVTISEGTAAMMELPRDKRILTVEQFDAMIHPDDLGALKTAVATAHAHRETIQNEFRLRLPSGRIRWMRSHWRFEPGDEAPTRATGAMIDITKEKNMLAQSQDARAAAEAAAGVAREAERLEQDRKNILELVAKDQPLEQIVTTMAAAVSSHLPGSLCSIRIELTEDSRISVYPLFPERLAKALELIAMASVRETSSPEPIANLSSDPAWLRFIETCGEVPFPQYRAVPILRNTRLTGLIVSFLGQGHPASQAEEKLLESWGQFASLAVERRGLYEQLSFRAQYDSLTTLLNRASLYDRLDAQIRTANPERFPMAVLYLDLDHFKEINDRCGHGAGDKVLQDVARRILDGVRRTDFAARIGGDEFVVILPGVSDRKEAGRVADLLMSSIEQPVSFNGCDLSVGASVGISIYPEDGANTDALLKMADEDMYRAKLKHTFLQPARTRERDEDPISTPSPVLLNA